MSKFTMVDEAPQTLEKGEIVIQAPNFLEEIRANAGKAGRGGLTGANHLRSIASSVGYKYDPENMNGYTVRVHQFEGRPYKSDEELNAIVCEMFSIDYPAIFQKYLDYHIKNRPANTKLIYLVKSNVKNQTVPFHQNGIDLVDSVKPSKTTKEKVVSKQAVSENVDDGDEV